MAIKPSLGLLAASMVLALSACSSIPRATKGGALADLWTGISNRDYLRTRGIGSPPSHAAGRTHRRGASRAAALAMARYELLVVVHGVKLEGGVTVAQLAERDSVVRELADDVVKGAHEVLTEWTDADDCVATIELRRSTVERLIQQKSKREKDLEKRLARAIDDARRADIALEVATMSKRDRRRWGAAAERAAEAKRMSERVDRLGRMVENYDPNNGSHVAAVMEATVEVGTELNKDHDESCWFPLMSCYWNRPGEDSR